MFNKNIMLIGGGNMGSALVKGILKAQLAPPEKITVVDIHAGKLGELSAECGVRVDTHPGPHMAATEVIVLAVKPQVLNDVIDALGDSIRSDQLVISILAGVETTYIRDRLGKENPVIRVMPNIAATVDAAASALAGCHPVTDEHYEVAEAIFGAVGTVVRVEEDLLDAVTGLSGSGPAYIYMVIEALCDGGVKMGLPRNVAMTLATQTVLGAAKLVRETGEHPATLRDQVTTAGGTTIWAVHELEERGLRAMLIGAVVTATKRSEELNRMVRDED